MLLLLSFISGMLTVLAPCVLPVLPILISGSSRDGSVSRPWLIILSFGVSVLIMTLSLQRVVQQFHIQPQELTQISGIILIIFGVLLLFPSLWQRLMSVVGGETLSARATTTSRTGFWGDVILGAVLGPVFNTCSPTYSVLIATILPVSFIWGLINVIMYIIGLSVMLAVISYGGRYVVNKLKWLSNPYGGAKRIIAIILIVMGVVLFMHREKYIETALIQYGLYIDTSKREYNALKQLQ